MSAWQFDLYVVPRRSQDAHRESAWDEAQPPRDFDAQLAALLPEVSSWLPEKLRTWGSQEGNRVDVLSEDGRVFEVFVRLDARDPLNVFIEGLADVLKSWECLLIAVSPSIQAVVEPMAESIRRALMASDAARFGSDPHTYLLQLKEQRNREE